MTPWKKARSPLLNANRSHLFINSRGIQRDKKCLLGLLPCSTSTITSALSSFCHISIATEQANRTRSQGDMVMLDGGKRFLRLFFSLKLGCLRLQQELLNIGEEKLARMQDLIKFLAIAAFYRVMCNCVVNFRSHKDSMSLWGWCGGWLLGCWCPELKGKEAFHYLCSPGG